MVGLRRRCDHPARGALLRAFLFLCLCVTQSRAWMAIGELNLSCDVIVVSHLSHQAIVFEGMHIKQQSPDWKTAKHHHIT